MSLNKIFGDVLRELRKNAQISQEELADLANLDRSYISLLERGIKQPTLQTIFSLSSSLSISPSNFISKVEKRHQNN
ncbi:helix-turn-helix transcriptional regulator [Carboxylicivirga mesophila]|uniref:Helix-turn-helix transcriptional regulator n=1 Tax=Carboxylicivirga mesophila TaxID=1166478 RepID=A0ABS5KCZ9_9BACT|nr:helix-turn-helix transcriptional regulator [Carboxylicivirga mesophila]